MRDGIGRLGLIAERTELSIDSNATVRGVRVDPDQPLDILRYEAPEPQPFPPVESLASSPLPAAAPRLLLPR